MIGKIYIGERNGEELKNYQVGDFELFAVSSEDAKMDKVLNFRETNGEERKAKITNLSPSEEDKKNFPLPNLFLLRKNLKLVWAKIIF